MSNYFKIHGSNIYDERRQILESAQFDGFEVTFKERLTNSEWTKPEKFSDSWCFVFGNRLFHFLTNYSGQIESFAELNTTYEANCGRCFQIHFVEVRQAFENTPADDFNSSRASKDAGFLERFG